MLSTVAKAAQVLSLFSPEASEWGVREAARALGISKSTAYELMDTLAEHNMLQRTEHARYRLGWGLFELSQTLLDSLEWRTEARKEMQELVSKWSETTHLAVLDGVQVVYVEKLQPTPAVKITASRLGSRLPAHCSGVGKLLLASCEWERVAEAIEHQGMPALTPNTITTLPELKAELNNIRRRGYAFDEQEVSIGLCCAAAPIVDRQGEVIAAVSLSIPAFRFYEGKNKYLKAIMESAERISKSAEYIV